jgi:putative FmdB family regulatory protein
LLGCSFEGVRGLPIFDYICSKCKGKFELLVSASDKDSVKCPKCGTRTLSRQLSTFAVVGCDSGGGSCKSCSTTSCST